MTGTETAPPEEASEPEPADEQSPAAPPADDRPRRRRRTAPRTHRVHTGIVVLVLVAVLVAVPFLILKASHTIANSKAGRTVTSLSAAASRLPDTPVALLVLKGADGAVAGLTLLALDGTGAGGTALVVPAGTEVAGGEGQPGTRLAAAYEDGGLAAERQAVEGLFGITTAMSEEVDLAGLAALLQPYAPIHLTLDAPALDTGPGGQQVVLQSPGAVDLTADQAAQLLLAHGPNESEVARLTRATAIWTAVLAAGASKAATAPTTTPATAPATVADQLAAMAEGKTGALAVPVQPVLDAVANPQGLDLLRVDEAPTKLLLAQIMPGAISPANDNIRLQVINATGDANLLADAVTRLAGVGANVVIVSDAASPSTATLIEYQDQRNKAEAQTYVPVVGPSTVQQSDERIDGIDATIVLGTDFASFAQQQAASSTTSVPSPSSTGP
jgi:LytR cell envelope-related transcriptional attenuator